MSFPESDAAVDEKWVIHIGIALCDFKGSGIGEAVARSDHEIVEEEVFSELRGGFFGGNSAQADFGGGSCAAFCLFGAHTMK